ncbi:Sfi1 spindle body protein-domain-containing protein [Vararia minispora EC-137]|uniref:Sfi1 spindle body protein-domain-containing protein n=1 Tax=Vararia minispora EC-137 TaxID=1314806 RepID=A0ACB8QCJ7_9AGAM|nr:Sfi1 spindle body protein-domain-containing protein [Vararia minispora EC-137]
MAFFRPARTSTPPIAKPTPRSLDTHTLVPTSSISDASRSSVHSTSELAALSPDDIDFIDAVIARAPPKSTTFLSLFKAYDLELSARGLKSEDEVEYYSKLLKIGTLKGSSWEEKWRMVKTQYGYKPTSAAAKSALKSGFLRSTPAMPVVSTRPGAARLLQRLRALQHEETHESYDSPAGHGIFSQTDATEFTETESQVDVAPPRFAHPRSPSPSEMTDDSHDTYYMANHPPTSAQPVRRLPTWTGRDSPMSDSPSTTPPSYHTHTNGAYPRDTKSHTAEKDGAWKRIKMQQDEEIAVQFWEDRLVERCWNVWKQGYEWTVATSSQISAARDSLVLRRAFQRWRSRTAHLRDLSAQVQFIADQKCLRRALDTWFGALAQRAQERWRNEMREKTKVVRAARETKLRKDAWAKWRQLYRSHISQQYYSAHLLLRTFRIWRTRLEGLDEAEVKADRFEEVVEKKVMVRAWEMWKGEMLLRAKEAVVARHVGLRIQKRTLGAWKQKMESLDTADVFYDKYVLKRALTMWKKAMDHVKVLERRADKHIARSDEILLIAITRIWRAKERGLLFERMRSVHIIKQALCVWRQRLKSNRTLEAKALEFASRSRSHVSITALQKWRSRIAATRATLSFASQYHTAQLQYKMLYIWRLQLRAKLKLARQARIVSKYFVARRAWVVWRRAMEERTRERRLEEYLERKKGKIFRDWAERALRQKRLRAIQQEVEDRVQTRILKNALDHWLVRVVTIKDRELLVAQKNDNALLAKAMTKWKTICIRHVDELSLMESYRAVAREESMKRMFYKWLNAARTTRHRRQVLQEAEKETRRKRLMAAWDTWRGRFETERLLPLERTLVMQNKHALMYKAFMTWHSKTRSLPAVRFYASTLKAKSWQKWRDAMPRALQAKAAREMDKRFALSHAYTKWLQALRTKRALRAVA